MFSADLMVDDPRKTADLLVRRLGLPPLRQTWTDAGKTFDDYLYLRAYHPYSISSPTLLEIINSGHFFPRTGSRPAAIGGQSERRPVKTHATVFITKRYGDLIAHLQGEGIRHYDMPDPGDGLARCWLGVEDLDFTSGPLNKYDAAADGGLFVEVISWEGTTLAVRGPIPVNATDGAATRIVARTWLVSDIDHTLGCLRRSLGWPDSSTVVHRGGDVAYATLQPALPASAALELVEPRHVSGRYGSFFSAWGPGPHAIRLAVNGLEARAAMLREMGTPFSESDTPNGERVLVVDSEVLGGAVFEFVEDIS